MLIFSECSQEVTPWRMLAVMVALWFAGGSSRPAAVTDPPEGAIFAKTIAFVKFVVQVWESTHSPSQLQWVHSVALQTTTVFPVISCY